MHCISCDKNLNDFEATRKHAVTEEYIDMCNKCFRDISNDVPTVVRSDLEAMEQIEVDELTTLIDGIEDETD